MLPAIREAQEVHLRGILGTAMLDKLKSLVEADTIAADENGKYQLLIEKCQYYLAYQTIAGLPWKLNYKLANIGVARVGDENVQVASIDEVSKVSAHYQAKADYYCRQLQRFLLDNRTIYPELDDSHCDEIRDNLRSAASCGVWLGGARGKYIRR